MNKKIVLLPVLLLSLVFLNSCEQTKEVNKYDNWQARNQAYVDSLQNVVDKKLDPNLLVLVPVTGSSAKNIYYTKKGVIDGITPSTNSPIYTDTVEVHYRGQLINKEVFDQSYSGKEKEDITNPASTEKIGPDFNFEVTRKFAVNGVVPGWTEILQVMKKGEHYKVYIPYQYGYGTSGQGNILGYSNLIFDVYLVNFWHPKPAVKSK